MKRGVAHDVIKLGRTIGFFLHSQVGKFPRGVAEDTSCQLHWQRLL